MTVNNISGSGSVDHFINTDPTDPSSPFYDPSLDPMSLVNLTQQITATATNAANNTVTDNSTTNTANNKDDTVSNVGRRSRRHARNLTPPEDPTLIQQATQNTQPTVKKIGK